MSFLACKGFRNLGLWGLEFQGFGLRASWSKAAHVGTAPRRFRKLGAVKAFVRVHSCEIERSFRVEG